MSTTASIAASRQTLDLVELECFFAEIASRIAVKGSDSRFGHPKVEKFFSELSRQVVKLEGHQLRLDRKQATGFNVFDFIDPDENKLSDVLAWLLDPKGSHGQGDVFLLLLFEHLGFGLQAKHTVKAKVQREAPTFGIQKYRRRMDVLVEAGAWLAIENKVDSLEQPGQVKDYLEHLQRCTQRGTIQSTLIYLTPNGRSPQSLLPAMLKKHTENGRLHCWSYQSEVRKWLEACVAIAKPQKIKIFLTAFIGYIESELKRESENQTVKEENDC